MPKLTGSSHGRPGPSYPGGHTPSKRELRRRIIKRRRGYRRFGFDAVARQRPVVVELEQRKSIWRRIWYLLNAPLPDLWRAYKIWRRKHA